MLSPSRVWVPFLQVTVQLLPQDLTAKWGKAAEVKWLTQDQWICMPGLCFGQ